MSKVNTQQIEISFIVLSFNKPTVLEKCLDSLLKQQLENFEILIVDSASTEDNLEVISRFQKRSSKVKVIKLTKNVGLCKAYNLGISKSSGKYLFIMNHDFLVDPESVAKLLKYLKDNIDIGAVMGKIKRYDFRNNKKTNLIDSCGIQMFRNRRFKDIGENQIDEGQFDGEFEVFGVSGAGSLYRREALESIKFENEYFDEDFFMYKDDIDVSWRLRWQRWKLYCITDAVFWHGRTSGGVSEKVKGFKNRLLSVIRNGRNKPLYVKKLSFRNQQLLLLKNDSISEITKNFIPISIRQLEQLIFNLIFSPSIILTYKDIFSLFKRFLKKRKAIVNKDYKKNVYKFIKRKPLILTIKRLVLSSKFKTLMITLNVIFLAFFPIWILTDVKLFNLNNESVTSSNVFETLYLNERTHLWENIFRGINKQKDPTVKKILLKAYIDLNPADQWYHTLFPLKDAATQELVPLYIQDSEWDKLIIFLKSYTEMNNRNAYYYYLIGYGYEMQVNLELAKEYYYQALDIESTQVDSLDKLVRILYNEGNYEDVKDILKVPLEIVEYQRTLCLFWGEANFSSGKQQCLADGSQDEMGYYHYIFNISDKSLVGMIRFDPILGYINFSELKINFNNKEPLVIRDFSDWIVSNDLKRESNNSFSASGVDPYIYRTLNTTFNASEVNNIEMIVSSYSNVSNKTLEILEIINEKEI